MWQCFLCEEEIHEGEPFTTVMVRPRNRRKVTTAPGSSFSYVQDKPSANMAAVHWSCSTDAIAARVVSALQGKSVSIGADGHDPDDFRGTIHGLVSRLLDLYELADETI